MQKLVIFFALVACSLAAPLDTSKEPSKPGDLNRPSPINPDIPSDPKPEEKITLIQDPKIQSLTTPKPTKLPGPFVLPREPLVRAKREDKDSSESDENSSEEEKKPSDLSTTPVPSTTLSDEGTQPRIPYAPEIHQHNEHLFKRTTDLHLNASSPSTTTTVAPFQVHANAKRDIPVPLTPKYQPNDDDESKPEEVPKEKTNQEEEKDEGHKTAVDQHPATIARPIPVAELFAKKPSTE